jgi:hypothetical protein
MHVAQAFSTGDGVTGVMQRPAPLLAALFVVTLLVASAGCIEQRDPPEHGGFTIEVESQPLFFTTTEGEELHGADAQVETELHHDHPEYSWDIEEVGEFEGSEVHLPDVEEGLYTASYRLDYYEQEEVLPLFLAAIEEWNGTYAVVAEGGLLEDPSNSSAQPFSIVSVDNLEPIGSGGAVDGYEWAVMEGDENLTGGLVINLLMDEFGAEETEYVVGYQWASGMMVLRWSASFVIHAGEAHNLTYGGPWTFNITIAPHDDPSNVTYQGNYTKLPERYRGRLGTLHWEGSVGGEEAPGLGLAGALVALSVAFVALGRRRRR